MKNYSLLVFLALFLLAFTPASAEEAKTAPQGIIIKPPETPGLTVKLSTSKRYYPPDGELEFEVEINKRAYLYVYSLDPDGNVQLLFPNKYDKDNLLDTGKHEFPRQGYSYLVGEDQRYEYLQAIVSTSPVSNFASIGSDDYKENPFPVLSEEPESFQSTTSNNLTSGGGSFEWSTAWTGYGITPYLSTLDVTSRPPGAEIHANGRYLGRTPGSVQVKPGEVEVEVKLTGFESWETSVWVDKFQTKSVDASLSPARESWLYVVSEPPGASVTFDGDFKGETPVGFSVTGDGGDLEVYKEGYKAYDEYVSLQSEDDNTLTVNLSPKEEGSSRAGPDGGDVSGPPVTLAGNFGSGLDGKLSLGVEAGVTDFLIGGSLRMTDKSGPYEPINFVTRTWETEQVVNYGPEWELYLGVNPVLVNGLGVRAGAGVAVQQRANLAPVESSSTSGYPVNPQVVEIARNASMEISTSFTFQAGVSLERSGLTLSLFYHNLRGFNVGIGIPLD
ncbi:MAG: PEGA domain-containing protein [Candidatus Acetothermia bacterium]